MFSNNKSIVMTNATLPPNTRVRIGQDHVPSFNATEPPSPVVVNKVPVQSVVDPNIPTGIYALYPSSATLQFINKALYSFTLLITLYVSIK